MLKNIRTACVYILYIYIYHIILYIYIILYYIYIYIILYYIYIYYYIYTYIIYYYIYYIIYIYMLKSYWYTTQEILLSSAISQAEVMSLAAASCGTRMYQESRITVSPSTQFKTWCKETPLTGRLWIHRIDIQRLRREAETVRSSARAGRKLSQIGPQGVSTNP